MKITIEEQRARGRLYTARYRKKHPRNYLESQFLPGMSWDNYGQWEVDHIVPLSWWPIKEHPELIFEASHYSNLRPRWKKDNQSKGARFAA